MTVERVKSRRDIAAMQQHFKHTIDVLEKIYEEAQRLPNPPDNLLLVLEEGEYFQGRRNGGEAASLDKSIGELQRGLMQDVIAKKKGRDLARIAYRLCGYLDEVGAAIRDDLIYWRDIDGNGDLKGAARQLEIDGSHWAHAVNAARDSLATALLAEGAARETA